MDISEKDYHMLVTAANTVLKLWASNFNRFCENHIFIVFHD